MAHLIHSNNNKNNLFILSYPEQSRAKRLPEKFHSLTFVSITVYQVWDS